MDKEKEQARKELLKIYEGLHPSERDLLNLCSIIFEPINKTTLCNVYRKTGLKFPGEKIESPKALDRHLYKLKSLRLLDENLQVPREIMEIVTRRAVAAGQIYNAGDFLKGIESEQAWTDKLSSGRFCISCSKGINEKAFITPRGPLCTSCVQSELWAALKDEGRKDWSVKRIIDALSPAGDIRSRLTAVLILQEGREILNSCTSGEANNLLGQLVQNLGYIHSHPLSQAVRQATLSACSRISEHRILPVLLDKVRKEPWQFYANVLTAARTVAPENPKVKALVTEATSDSNPEIRRTVLNLFSKSQPSWAGEALKKLGRDEVGTIREQAKRALDQMKSRQGRSVYDRWDRFEVPQPPQRASLRFGPLVRAIHSELPVSGRYSYSDTYSCPRIMRDIRIAIYARDGDLFRRRWEELDSHCSASPDYDGFIARTCTDPFDAEWFDTLSPAIRKSTLSAIFLRAIFYLEPDAEVLAYVMKDPLFKSVPGHDRINLLYLLAIRLILGGRLSEAKRIISEIEGPDFSFGLMGCVRFLEGKNDEAVELFETDLKELRRRFGKRNIYFTGFVGVIHLLALLKSGDRELLKKADQLISWAFSPKGDPGFNMSTYRSLRGILQAQKLEIEQAKNFIKVESKATGVVPFLFNAIATFWVHGSVFEEMLDRLNQIFHGALAVEMNWFVLEAASLILRFGREDPKYLETLERVAKQTGIQPLVSSIIVEEAWEKSLRALMQIGNEIEGTQESNEIRLVWLVRYDDGEVFVQPTEQKITAKGDWSKGRSVPLTRLAQPEKPEFVGPEDHAICAALKRDSYYHNRFVFDMDLLLPALVGHPRLFQEKSPTTPVEFVKGEPEIRVAKAGSKLKINFGAELNENRFIAAQETPTRFKVIEVTEKHRQIARVLGGRGLTVPVSAKQEVMSAVSALSSHVLIHSDIGGKSKDAVEVPSDPTPHAHLLPVGPGFRVEVFVKPFKVEGGPYLKPAAGAVNVIADVNGTRMQTQRDLKAEESMADALEGASPTLSRLADSDRQWMLEDPEDCLQVLLDLKALQDKGHVVVEWPEGEKLRITREFGMEQFRMKIRGKENWFEVSGRLQVDDKLVLDMKRLLELLSSADRRFIQLEEGSFLALSREFRKRLEELDALAETKGKEIRLHPLAALAVQDLIQGIPNVEVDEAWKSRLERIRVGQELIPSIPSTLKAELREYQLEGYTWMARLAHMGIGACLADDMGLGKTVQALAVMLQRAAKGPSLVIAPTSVCWNWITEANRFAPTLNVVQFNGNDREGLVRNLKPHDVLVTSYGLLIHEAELLSTVDWNTIVLDEAQAIKNVMTKRSQAAMGLRGEFRIITTGTPIENHLGELWTLFNFINPGLLGSLPRFNARFAVPIEKYSNREAKKRLKRLIQPFILRRLKSQVLEELPPRTEVVLQVEMSTEEAAFYEALRRQALEKIEADNTPITQKHIKILAEITKLRQAACNPQLVFPESRLSSSKLELFGEVVSELLESRHKALVFSQFVGHLNLIRQYLDEQEIGYRYIDGSTPPKDRKKEVDRFQSGEGDLFLISLKAGGLGLNLTAADYVIHMDPWWNPAVEDQASDRAHRIGQQHPVTVYRLVTKGTIEEKIVRLHQEKRDLAGSLLDGSDISGRISAEELIRLIKDE